MEIIYSVFYSYIYGFMFGAVCYIVYKGYDFMYQINCLQKKIAVSVELAHTLQTEILHTMVNIEKEETNRFQILDNQIQKEISSLININHENNRIITELHKSNERLCVGLTGMHQALKEMNNSIIELTSNKEEHERYDSPETLEVQAFAKNVQEDKFKFTKNDVEIRESLFKDTPMSQSTPIDIAFLSNGRYKIVGIWNKLYDGYLKQVLAYETDCSSSSNSTPNIGVVWLIPYWDKYIDTIGAMKAAVLEITDTDSAGESSSNFVCQYFIANKRYRIINLIQTISAPKGKM